MNINAINNHPQKGIFITNTPENTDKKINKLSLIEKSKDNVSFKGKDKAGKEAADFISKFFGEKYAEKLLNKKWVRDLSEKLSSFRGSMTEHMATLGSLITSSVYVARTLNNKELQKENKTTLAINQTACFVVPTICAYTVNSLLAGFNKKLEYRYAGIQEQKLALKQITAEEAAKARELTSGRLKGFKTLASLATFTLIYRYFTPVVITPIANRIGRWINNRNEEKNKTKIANA